MSIYSGFPTRRDEQRYNSLLGKLLTTLQQHLLILLGPAPADLPPKQLRAYTRILSRMRDYEEHKYLPPKFTNIMEPLCRAIGLPEAVEVQVQIAVRADQREGRQGREAVKASSRSLHKPKFNVGIHQHLTDPPKKPPPTGQDLEPLSTNASGLLPRKALFQSCSSKLSRPKTLKGIFPANHRVEISEEYEQPSAGEWESVKGRKGSKGGGRVRYRAFQALQEAQEHLNKRQVPLREEMRRKLKTEGEGGGRDQHSG